MTKVRQALGAWGERLAAAHLVAAGMVVLDRNWRGAGGEIDIIARDGNALVFCEVKTRRGTVYGTPAEAVGWAKVRKLRHLATQWLAVSGIRPSEVRFDVVSVRAQRDTEPVVDHIRGAF
ncbi:YraN family protein [Catellatospora sp. KI3]|uniref:YraN family protein n=1 Tax=Catellatospora sp. KI3 TaxID=3041620 RepID=UPI00248296F5|nr:YraN family protein [Catellatospora sp. KI3]MDI1459465.1 YraN family protein [Catellatospora sp. KI3]